MNKTAEAFTVLLAETIAWCDAKANFCDPANSLRTPSLQPKKQFWGESGPVWDVCFERQRQLSNLPTIDTEKVFRRHGRLLLYLPDYSLSYGLAGLASKGYFLDEVDDPPWDTWIHCIQYEHNNFACGCLVSWVPEEFYGLVQSGMDNNADPCLQWADACDKDLFTIPEWMKMFCP